MNRSVIVLSLGTGTNVEYGIAKSIRAHNPSLVVFIATKESFETLDKVESLIKTPFKKKHIILEDKDDIEDCYRTIRDTIQWLIKQGYSSHEIIADFTSGTKAMSAGLTLGAIAADCQTLSYVAGKRNPKNGRVITGTERVISLTPSEIYAVNRTKLAITMFNS